MSESNPFLLVPAVRVLQAFVRVTSLGDLRTLRLYQLKYLVLVPGFGEYYYNETSTATDIGNGAAVKPESVAFNAPGRWLPASEIGLIGTAGTPGADGNDGAPGADGPPGAGATFTAENKDGVTIKAGQAVSIHSSGTGVVLADADDAGYPCDGIATEDIASTFSGTIMTEGTLTLADWTDATGGVTLAAKGTYRLARSAGELATVVDMAGALGQDVGRALAPDTLEVMIRYPILL